MVHIHGPQLITIALLVIEGKDLIARDSSGTSGTDLLRSLIGLINFCELSTNISK